MFTAATELAIVLIENVYNYYIILTNLMKN